MCGTQVTEHKFVECRLWSTLFSLVLKGKYSTQCCDVWPILLGAPHPRTPHHSLTISSNTHNMDLIDTIRNVSKRYARRPIKWPWKKLNTTTPSSSTTPSTTTMGPTSPETISSVIDGFYNVSDCLDGNCSWASLDNMTDMWADSTLCEGSGTTTDFIVMMITAFVLGVVYKRQEYEVRAAQPMKQLMNVDGGNVFVIAAILLERNLQNVANYLILSLAVADLLVACLVMPLGAVYEVSRQWTLGPELCDMWTSSDVLCCTASILHLVAIALDRYWAVTNIDYIHQRTAKRIGLMIFIIWCVSFLVCIAPLLGWKDGGWESRVRDERTCLVSQDIGYQIFATASSFYLPLLVILILYWRIFQTARKRIRRRINAAAQITGAPRMPGTGGVVAGLCMAGATGNNGGGLAAAMVGVIGRPLPTISEATTTTTTTAVTNVSSTNTSPEKVPVEIDPTTNDLQVTAAPVKVRKKEAADSKRERKAAKTLAIITGAFVCCWLPFFIIAIVMPICHRHKCSVNKYLVAFFLWLGYFNSTLNPIIYTIFSPEFRHAFKRLLCGRRNGLKRRIRTRIR
ncbi:hypothetical protein M8J75_001461 [Diaphorina citri]|nr:hypothetical protein M8J75_001461 [Diaphorina citri]